MDCACDLFACHNESKIADCVLEDKSLEIKSKRIKLDTNTANSTSPCKVALNCSTKEELHICKGGKTTAILVQPFGKIFQMKSNGSTLQKQLIWRGLLDSGSTGDILFVKKGAKNGIPYVTRDVPQAWHTTFGIYHTYKCTEFEITLPEYSHSKRILIHPDVVEYDGKDNAPPFDLIIGEQTLSDLKAHLDWENKMITIDDIKLPMRNIKNLQIPILDFNCGLIPTMLSLVLQMLQLSVWLKYWMKNMKKLIFQKLWKNSVVILHVPNILNC